MKSSFTLWQLLTIVVGTWVVSAQQLNQPPPYDGCNSTDYYAGLLAIKPDWRTWTRADVTQLVVDNHRRQLPNVAPQNGGDDILVALVDLFPGQAEESVHLVYRDIDFPAVPAGSPNTWRREDLWPIDRGVLRSSPALTDAHGKVPADSTVLFIKAALFFGECGTVEALSKCRMPATVESANDTMSDGKIFAPPEEYRGDIARGLFYTELRYKASLGLTLTDCPPFGFSEFGYLTPLLQWHDQDDVSPQEMARNDRICDRWQGNRNPFIDYPGLVPLFFGQPDTIVSGSTTYTKCTEPTSSPTAVPNACSALRAGDVPVYLSNSDDPDQIVFYPLANIDVDVEYLYVTDNAWNGNQLLETEGTLRFTIPEDGIIAGQSFGFGEGSPYADNWEIVGETDTAKFELSTEGDQIFIYCLDADNVPNFLWGYSYNGPWLDAGLTAEEYGEGFSALPRELEVIGNLALPHQDNCVFDGDLAGLKTELQEQFMDPAEFNCLDDERIEILGNNTDRSAAHDMVSVSTTGAMGLAGLFAVLGL